MKFTGEIEKWRIRAGSMASRTGEDFGSFIIPGPCNRDLRVIASNSSEEVQWEHVSVSLANRCPNWPEMDFIKRIFWDDEETVMQLHPPRSQWINNHEFCLHLWRPTNHNIPLPPQIAVGIPDPKVVL